MEKRKRIFLIAAFLCIFVLQGCSATEVVDKANNLLGLSSTGKEATSEQDGSQDKQGDLQDEQTGEDDLPVIVFETEEETPVIETKPTEEPFVYDDVNKIYSIETTSDDEIVLTFGGDVCFYDEYANMTTLRAQENGIFGCILPEVMDEMKAADVFMVNNEFAYSNRGTPVEGKTYAFRSKPENVELLHDMGVDIVSLANNHAYDFGPEALYDTFDTLNTAKIPFVGAGKNIEEAKKPVYFKMNGKTIAYVSATQIERTAAPDTKEATENSPGVLRTLDSEKFVDTITTARANSDFVVVYVHWGSENTDLVEESQRALAKEYVQAGAGLIIGDHSHCLQGIDFVDDVPVFYSMGNFWFNSKTVDTGLARIRLDAQAKIKDICFLPCIQQNCKTRKADKTEQQRILTYLQGISNYATIDADGFVTKSDTDKNTQGGQNTSLSKRPDASTEDMTVPGQMAAPAENNTEPQVAN